MLSCRLSLLYIILYVIVESCLKPAAGGRERCNTKSTVKILITNFGNFVAVSSYANLVSADNCDDLYELSLGNGIRVLVTTLITFNLRMSKEINSFEYFS